MKRARLVVALVVATALVGFGAWLRLSASAEAQRREAIEVSAAYDVEHGQADQAVVKLKALAELEPNRPGVQRALGRALTAKGAAVEALPVLTAAVSANPRDAEALEYQAVAMSQLGRAAEAKQVLTQALELDRSRVSAWRRLAQVCLATGDTQAAVAAWKEAAVRATSERHDVLTEARTLLEAAGHASLAEPFINAP